VTIGQAISEIERRKKKEDLNYSSKTMASGQHSWRAAMMAVELEIKHINPTTAYCKNTM